MSARWRRLAVAASLFATLPAAALPPQAPWTLRHPASDPVPFHTLLTAGPPQGPAFAGPYPGSDPVSFFAGILAHAAFNAAVRNARAEKMQAEADRVLDPLRPQLEGFTHGGLLRLALEQVPAHGASGVGSDAPTAAAWQVRSMPAFLMSQDHRVLILDHAIGIFPPGENEKPLYATTVRVISRARTEEDVLAAWQSDESLKRESVRLLAHSLVLALRDAGRAPVDHSTYRTIRYRFGAAENFERAQPLENWCERQVMRTLRGWLLSAPVPAGEGGPACDPSEMVRN